MTDAADIALRDASGRVLAHVSVAGGAVSVDPPEAAGHPFVAAAVGEIRRTLARPRPRPACAPSEDRGGC